jgi:predicted transposase YdaD
MLRQEQLERIPIVREALKKGREEGRQEGREEGREKGRQEGREEGELHSLKLYLETRFPALAKMSELDHLTDRRKIERILKKVYRASNERSARDAILGRD